MSMFTGLNPRSLWAGTYIGLNLLAYVWIRSTGYLMGDGDGIPLDEPLLLDVAAILVCFSIAALYFLFQASMRIKPPTFTVSVPHGPLAFVLSTHLTSFILYVGVTGLFIAGSSERGGTVASALYVLLNVDLLFILFYATSRDSRWYKYVAVLWFVSIIQRGWFAYVFVLVGMESFRYIRRDAIKAWHVLVIIALLAAYPLLDAIKVYIRLTGGFNLGEFLRLGVAVAPAASAPWGELMGDVFEKIVGRIQIVSHAYIIMQQSAYFDYQNLHGTLNNFWKEGIFGVVADALQQNERLRDVPQFLALYIAPDMDSSWNVNPSLVGWLFIYRDQLVLAASYLLLVSAASVLIMRMISSSLLALDTLWFIWLIYLSPGWVAQFIGFLFGLMSFLVILLVLRLVADMLRAGSAAGRIIHGRA